MSPPGRFSAAAAWLKRQAASTTHNAVPCVLSRGLRIRAWGQHVHAWVSCIHGATVLIVTIASAAVSAAVRCPALSSGGDRLRDTD